MEKDVPKTLRKQRNMKIKQKAKDDSPVKWKIEKMQKISKVMISPYYHWGDIIRYGTNCKDNCHGTAVTLL